LKTRLIIWLTACLAILVISFGKLWVKLPEWLSPDGLERHGVFHWGVLGLCILWLYLKRKDILPRMQTGGFNFPFMLGGVALLVLSIFLPRSDDLLVFLMLLGWLGIFTMLFSRAAVIPAILLMIYGFSVVFPIFAIRWLGEPSAIPVISTVTAITQVLGLPITSQGQVLHFTSVNGDVISTTVSVDCAGYATIGVFIALFALMMLDIRLPLKKAWYVFLFGLAGTWLQNIVRIVVSVVAGYNGGLDALWTMHANIAYVIFPLWFALFAFIYLRQAGWRSKKKA
jgi:exosortase/archaeosortase family protein